MARVTYVKKAQQRYATVPVIDPETGQQKRTPVMRRNGEQKTSKKGPVFLRVTQEDKSKPLPNRVCEHCRTEIKPGDPYKHVTPKSGPYGGHKRVRCAKCPTWQQWDLSNSLSAQLAKVSHDANSVDTTDADNVRNALTEAAEAIREIADAKREGAQNIEEGFGHPTQTSDELESIADELESWADEVEAKAYEIEDRPEEEVDCNTCGGQGTVENEEYDEDDPENDEPAQLLCPDCDGSGYVENEEEISDWESTVEDALSIVDESPV